MTWIVTDFSRQSWNLDVIPLSIRRRDGSTRSTEMLGIRISFLRGLRYISIRITPFFFMTLDLGLRR